MVGARPQWIWTFDWSRRYYERVEPNLYRYPALDQRSLESAMESIFGRTHG
jgi:hypothetical protein